MTKVYRRPVLIRVGSVQILTRALDVGVFQEPGDTTHYFYF